MNLKTEEDGLDRFREAYQRMARQARYRPAAPSDGLGSLDLTPAERRNPALLNEEASRYARAFLDEEDSLRFFIGCSHYPTNRALVYAIEAARLLCAKTPDKRPKRIAARLMRMALKELEAKP